jgi:hypothetical protein
MRIGANGGRIDSTVLSTLAGFQITM